MADGRMVLKANPVKIFKDFAPQKYKRQRSNEESSNSSWESLPISPMELPSPSIINPVALVNPFQTYQSPFAPRISPFNAFTTSTPAMAQLNAAPATDESINLTISFLKAMHAAASPFVDHAIDATKMYPTAPPIKMEMPPSPYATNDACEIVRPLTVQSIVSDLMYDDKRYNELMQAEEWNLSQFITTHLEHFPLKRTYSREKVRSVCQRLDSEPASEAKAKYRQLNNENSQRSRHKQKIARIQDALIAVFLRDRIASYERRIAKMIDTIMDPNGIQM